MPSYLPNAVIMNLRAGVCDSTSQVRIGKKSTQHSGENVPPLLNFIATTLAHKKPNLGHRISSRDTCFVG